MKQIWDIHSLRGHGKFSNTINGILVFNPYQEHKIHISIWIQLQSFPIEWFDSEILYGVALKLGTPVKVDPRTFQAL